ncbi:MAG: four helix bundle protein [Chlorobi bacterium]|nr:four helix bundle protein [Chlorobiota bacterium]
MKRLDIENLEIYEKSMDIGDVIWDIVIKWDNFARNAFGYQLVKSADSIAANISEGYGRYFFKENRQFCYIARGSLYETITWLKKATKRKLITSKMSEKLLNDFDILLKKLNAYINYIEKQIDKK